MDLRRAKEYLHLRDWLATARQITDAGREEYRESALLQEAGDSLMMKIGETANRLARVGEPDPDGTTWARVVANRNWLIHQYDQIDRDVTWTTLVNSLPELAQAVQGRISDAERVINVR